jgi:uncharacterized membrane protein YobD (UPF0266 family)
MIFSLHDDVINTCLKCVDGVVTMLRVQLLNADELQSYIFNNTLLMLTTETMPNNGTIDLTALNGRRITVQSHWNAVNEVHAFIHVFFSRKLHLPSMYRFNTVKSCDSEICWPSDRV